ncbi:N-acyl homoserine lactonase family protein [Rhodobacteraceae bacterium NNCM2]|nr:N-acyl homoserine lactonase family protein [Coraliihabitans acroporae]
MDEIWEVFALKYGTRPGRTRNESFMFDDDHLAPHPIDYFVWVVRNENRTILVDTGYDPVEAQRRGRPILRHPVEALKSIGIAPEDVDTVIVTHLHYDHAGTLDCFPNAMFHLQEAEIAYATGPCMCMGVLKMPFTMEHVVQMVKHIYSGKVIFHSGDGAVAPGVTLHAIGGHSKGLMSVRVKTKAGWLCLASDASHFYENFMERKHFPIVVDLEAMCRGWDIIKGLASSNEQCVPGHDPLVLDLFPSAGVPDVVRLDQGAIRKIG